MKKKTNYNYIYIYICISIPQKYIETISTIFVSPEYYLATTRYFHRY